MKKIICSLSAVLIIIFAFSSCSSPLPKEFDEETVKNQATEVVQLLSEKKYDEVCAKFDPVMKQTLKDGKSVEEALGAVMDSLGAFKSVTKAETAGTKDKAGNPIAVVVLACEHEKKNAVYTISIDKNNQICGLYVK